MAKVPFVRLSPNPRRGLTPPKPALSDLKRDWSSWAALSRARLRPPLGGPTVERPRRFGGLGVPPNDRTSDRTNERAPPASPRASYPEIVDILRRIDLDGLPPQTVETSLRSASRSRIRERTSRSRQPTPCCSNDGSRLLGACHAPPRRLRVAPWRGRSLKEELAPPCTSEPSKPWIETLRALARSLWDVRGLVPPLRNCPPLPEFRSGALETLRRPDVSGPR